MSKASLYKDKCLDFHNVSMANMFLKYDFNVKYKRPLTEVKETTKQKRLFFLFCLYLPPFFFCFDCLRFYSLFVYLRFLLYLPAFDFLLYLPAFDFLLYLLAFVLCCICLSLFFFFLTKFACLRFLLNLPAFVFYCTCLPSLCTVLAWHCFF